MEFNMQQFLILLKPTRLEMITKGPTQRESQVIDEHFAYLEKLTEQGVMILVGRTQNNDANTFGIAILQAGSESEARAVMEQDPVIINQVMKAELYPYKIALVGKLPE
jgi:uncharacterized protein YciI